MIIPTQTATEWFPTFELTPDFVCIAGKDGYFRKVNASVIQKLGYTEAELLAVPISSFIHPEDKSITQSRRAKLLEGVNLVDFENRYITKSGKHIWLHWTSIYLPETESVFAVAKDITAKKQIEKEIAEQYKKFEGLASHFKTSVEKDRKYFAYELQEQVAQLAAVIKMDVDSIAGTPGLPDLVRDRIDHAVTVSNLLLKTIQRISFSISPKMLEDFGLTATLEWLCNEFSILNKVPCSFDGDYHEKHLSPEVRTDFFRICQVFLADVIDHSLAGHIRISIHDLDDSIRLKITDEGNGFSAERFAHPAFTDIRERVASINGKLEMKENEVSVTV